MKRLAAAIAVSALLPLAGCATPYGYSQTAWAYYDDDYDYGHDGYERPITYSGTYYGEAEYGRPYGNAYYDEAAQGQTYGNAYYFEPTYGRPYSDANYARRPYRGCHCGRPARGRAPAHDASWYSTYYIIGGVEP